MEATQSLLLNGPQGKFPLTANLNLLCFSLPPLPLIRAPLFRTWLCLLVNQLVGIGRWLLGFPKPSFLQAEQTQFSEAFLTEYVIQHPKHPDALI